MESKKVFLCFVVFCLFVLLFIPFQKNIFSIQFGDEDDNFVIGQWILQEKKLYGDIFYNHQPIPILASSAFQKIYQPVNIFSLIKYHRLIIFAYSAICSLGLVYLFGPPALFFVFLYELSKFTLLGTLFLTETLLVYPLIFIIGAVYKLFESKKLAPANLLIFSASLIFIQLSLLPLTPFVFLTLYLGVKRLKHPQKVNFLKILLTLTVLSILLLAPFISFIDYFKDTILANLLYVIPQETSYSVAQALQRIFLWPILILFLKNSGFYLLLKILSVCYLLSAFVLVKKKNWRTVVLLYVLLVTTNCRPLPFGLFKEGFHLLPFYASLLWTTVLQLTKIFKLKSRSWLERGLSIFLLVSLTLLFIPHGFKEFTRRNTPIFYWQVNYSNFSVYGETVRLLADTNDTLLTIPAASLIYWQSGLFPNSRFFFILDFMKKSQVLRSELQNAFRKNPPTFLYLEESEGINQVLSSLENDYQQITKDNKLSLLFIHKNKLPKISEAAWEKVKLYGFEKPRPTL